MRDRSDAAQERLRALLGIADPSTFLWERRVQYFMCSFFRVMQHSAYLRLLEEVVDLYLDHVGMNIGELCRERSWIPVVQDHELRIDDLVEMEERIVTAFRVTRIVARRLFDADVEWYAIRNGSPRRVAGGRIMHGYVRVGEPEWASRLVALEPWMLERLTPPGRGVDDGERAAAGEAAR